MTLPAYGQVDVVVPQNQYKRYEGIEVGITNRGSKLITICVEFGQRSSRGENEELDSTPIPFYVQSQNGRKWGTLLIGPDIGSVRSSVILEPEKTQHYPFHLHATGKMRLILNYWIGENEDVCNASKGKKTAQSKVFVVQ